MSCVSAGRVAEGTEGFTPSISEGNDLGGEDTPSTGGVGGVHAEPELLVGWLHGGGFGTCVVDHGRVLCWSLLDVTAIGAWDPWLGWEWWDGWGLWWAEGGGEGVGLGVLGEDGNVSVPVGLGGVVRGDGGGVSTSGTVKGVTGGPGGGGDLGWEVSDDSDIVVCVCWIICRGSSSSGSFTIVGSDGRGREVGDVTHPLFGSSDSSRARTNNNVLVWGAPI